LKAENKNYMVEVQKLEKKLKNYDSLEQENAELKKKLQSYEVYSFSFYLFFFLFPIYELPFSF